MGKDSNPDVFYESIPFKLEEEEVSTPASVGLVPMLKQPHWDNVTQTFLNPNSIYPTTGVHIGVDFGCPEWTPVYAPADGRVTRNEVNHNVLGNCGYFLFQHEGAYWAFRYAHLVVAPIVGDYKQGDIIGFTGNTGLSTGAHLHVDLWVEGIIRINQLSDKADVERWCRDIKLVIVGEVSKPTPTPVPDCSLDMFSNEELLEELSKRLK